MATNPTEPAQQQKLFISYAHQDADWLDRFKPYLTPAAKSGALNVWWDREGIPSGAEWAAIIDRELTSATAALVLVSDNLLASDFIREKELPAIHGRRRAGDLQLYWVPLRDVGRANLRLLGLDEVQAAVPCNPASPLDGMKDDRKRRQAVAAICDRILVDLKIVERLGRAGRLSDEKRQDVVRRALERLPKSLDLAPGDVIDCGDFTIVCRGRLGEREVAIKVLAESPFRERDAEFEDRVKKAGSLEDPAFLKLRYYELTEEPHLLVLDYLDKPTLAQHLARMGGPLPPGQVARLIERLVVALQEYHRRGLRYGTLNPGNVFYDDKFSLEPMLRLQAITISSHLSQSNEMQSWFPRDAAQATYLAPEQYEGQPYTEKSDQYGVGLLAFEMLEGRPPVPVTRLAHFETKRQFYEDPGRFAAGAWPRDHSHLKSVIFRMLHKDPSRRFESLADVHGALAHLEPADVALAKKSYVRACAGNTEFYAEFYRRFFGDKHCPEARAMFHNIDEQYAKLDSALHYLLNFGDQDMTEPTALTAIARRHEHLHVTGEQFDHFAAALLETLREFSREDEAAIEAWRQTIRSGVQYLKFRAASAAKSR